MLQETKRDAASKRIPFPSNEAKPMLQEAKRDAATVKSPSPEGMEKSVHVRVKRVLPEAKLHKREGDAGLRACSHRGIPFPFVRASALFTRTSVFQKGSRRRKPPQKKHFRRTRNKKLHIVKYFDKMDILPTTRNGQNKRKTTAERRPRENPLPLTA